VAEVGQGELVVGWVFEGDGGVGGEVAVNVE
jgi:hypothetical protein